jgi:CRP-like cAMP-binding protein
MNIASYIQRTFGTNEPLPFEVKQHSFAKKHIITNIGDVEQNIYYLTSGIVEAAMLKDSDERIIDFFFPGQFFSAYTSFLTRKSADVYLLCLTDCSIEAMPYQSLSAAYKTSLITNQLGRHLTETVYLARTQREKDFLTKSAEQRYIELLQNRPEIIEQIPVNKVAKYLGIHPESLSRLRKEINA